MRINYVSKKKFSDPIKESFIVAKGPDGEEFTIRQWRESLEKSLCYEVIKKKIKTKVVDIKIQEEAIKDLLLAQKEKINNDWSVEGFLLILRNIVEEEKRFLKDDLEAQFPTREMELFETDHPLVFDLKLPPFLLERIWYNIERIIPKEDRDFFCKFVEEENKEEGVVLLKVGWDFELSDF